MKKEKGTQELKRRTVLKALIWRIIGVVWTWIGAYFIILLIPPSWKNAAIIATLIVAYHHSTRMVMYYFYERIWNNITWGTYDAIKQDYKELSVRDKLIWIISSILSIVIILFLIIYVTPLIKK